MKRLLAIGLIVLCGCEPPLPPDNVHTFQSSEADGVYKIIELDGCEYFWRKTGWDDSRSIEFSHRGSCKRCWNRLIEAIHAKAEKEGR